MLKTLTLHNFALFSDTSVIIDPCLTVITGETGAGKSMLMDALQFLQGQKLSTPQRDPELDTTVSVVCDPRIQEVLNKHLDDKQLSSLTSPRPTEWTLTRTLSKSGRTKSCINQTQINNKQLQAIVSTCIRSHSQHAHLSFCQETQQRDTLDCYGQHQPYLKPVREAYLCLQQALEKKRSIEKSLREIPSSHELQSVLDDLAPLELHQTNLDELNQQHRILQNRQSYLVACQQANTILDGDQDASVMQSLYDAQKKLESFTKIYEEITPTASILSESLTLAREATYQLNTILDCDYSQDHEQLQKLDQKLSAFHSVARKYRTDPQTLTCLESETLDRLKLIEQYQQELPELNKAIFQAQNTYQDSCQKLHEKRKQSAEELSQHITKQLPDLNLPFGQFAITCTIDPSQARIDGTCSITFLFSANPGQDLQTLSQGTSGGELARLALLLQSAIPATYPIVMIFDEADVGVSGKTAILIGNLLKKMAQSYRVLCITHSPQVASCGQSHWHITKEQTSADTQTFLEVLDHSRHIEEVARLLSGSEITPETRANAEQLCTQ